MATFKITMYKNFEAWCEVEADTAEQACEMISNGDFSQMVEDSYDEDLSEQYIYGVRVFDEHDNEVARWDSE